MTVLITDSNDYLILIYLNFLIVIIAGRSFDDHWGTALSPIQLNIPLSLSHLNISATVNLT